MKQLLAVLFVLVLVLGFSFQAYATLELRGEGTSADGSYRLIYDTDLNITWYDYTRPYDSWQTQMSWASALTVNFSGTNFDNWRLPTALNQDGTGPCQGENCTGSEMGHLYFTDLGNKSYPSSTTEYGLRNKGDFLNLREFYYWSSTEYAADTNYAWLFYTHVGAQGYDVKYRVSYALAVRDGDVASAVAPEPISSTLFLTGGATLIGRKYIRRKKKEV